MRTVLLAAMLLMPVAHHARADGFDLKDIYRRVDDFVKSLTQPAPRDRDLAKVPFAEIDPKMAVMPRETGTLRVIPPPAIPGSDPRVQPR